jgi:amidase
MERRDFLHRSLIGAAGAALAGGRTAGVARQAPVPEFEFEESTIAGLQEAMTRGALTARALAHAYLTRIQAVDRTGPAINSVIELNTFALVSADALDRERRFKGVRGPLHGIPVLLKDNIDTADGMKTSAGSLALAESIPRRDAFLVERLRAAGVVLLGKTNLSEWANFRSTRSTSGWSGRGGLTRNPYVLDRNPCGSSSGSGAAAAASLCAAAVGTETDGSIVCPSSACALVGIKPTVGLVSRSGIVPISISQDTAGPMARTVADAAALLSAMTGVDPRDAATAAGTGHAERDYTALDPDGLKGARIGVVRSMFGRNDHVARLAEAAIDTLKHLGAVVIDPVAMPAQGKFDADEYDVLLYEFKAGLNDYLAALSEKVAARTLKDLIAFNEEQRDREMRWFGQEIFVAAEAKGPLTTAAYRKARQKCVRLSRTDGIDAVMAKHRLDALVAPTGDPPFTTDLVNGDHYTGGGTSTFPAVSGYPHVTVPAGDVLGLPVGFSFFGRAWSEPVLIKFAYAFEQATKRRKPPRFTATLSLDA